MDKSPDVSCVNSVSFSGVGAIGSVIAALVFGRYDLIPPQYGMYAAIVVLIAHFITECIPQPSAQRWYYWPYRALSWLGGNFKWAERHLDK